MSMSGEAGFVITNSPGSTGCGLTGICISVCICLCIYR